MKGIVIFSISKYPSFFSPGAIHPIEITGQLSLNSIFVSSVLIQAVIWDSRSESTRSEGLSSTAMIDSASFRTYIQMG